MIYGVTFKYIFSSIFFLAIHLCHWLYPTNRLALSAFLIHSFDFIYECTFLSYQAHYLLEPYTKIPIRIFHKSLYGL